MDDLVQSGKVRSIGCSNFLSSQVAWAIGRSEAPEGRFDAVQPRSNLLVRQVSASCSRSAPRSVSASFRTPRSPEAC